MTRSNRPNLVYVFADQLRLQSCGYVGEEPARTPVLDRLAGQSLDLRQTVSNTPVCAAYRATLLTGKYTSSHGMVINELRLSPEHRCLGHALRDAGYATSYIGKWHLWANELGHHDATRNGFVPPGPYRLGFDDFWAGYNFNHDSFDGGYFRDTPERIPWDGYEADAQTDLAIERLRTHAADDPPFALFLSWGPPHDPWSWDNVPPDKRAVFEAVTIPRRGNVSNQPDPYTDDWQRLTDGYLAHLDQSLRGYHAQVANLDDNLGRLLAEVDELGLSDDTIFVFTSDHGEMFASHGRRAKLTFYEEACRVPFLLRWPGEVEPRVSDACFSAVDIMPTLLGLLGIDVPAEAEGTDCSEHVLTGSGPEPEAAYLQGMGATAAWVDGTEWRAVRDKRYTYAIYRVDGKELLFDHVDDPLQLTNLADDPFHAETVAVYRSKLLAWMRAHHDEFQPCSWYEARWTRDRNIVNTARGGPGQDLQQLEAILNRYDLHSTRGTDA